jgi:hypothetical protein
MSLLSVANDVCRAVGVHEMTSVINNTLNPRTAGEMLALANEMAQRIAYDTREWTELRRGGAFSGDGVATAFPLPANYKRMLLGSNVWRSTTAAQPMRFIPDLDEWNQRRALGYSDPRGEWIINGGEMHISPVMGTGILASFSYLEKNCITVAGTGQGDRFLNDDDVFRLDERLLKLAMIWQWKAQKGSPYAEDMASYETALARLAGSDTPAPIIVDRLPISSTARVAFPWPSTWP